MSRIIKILLLVTGLVFNSQYVSSTDRVPAYKYLVSVTENSEIPLSLLKDFTSGFGSREITRLLKYGVKSYSLVYRTSYKGKEIEASGLLLVPSGITKDAPIISLQHGTTFSKQEAPSAGSFTGMELFSSAGYIVLIPDFIGYGSSSEIFHPYYDKKHSAYTVIDMIKSAKEFLDKEKVGYNDQLFLAGYSEGGYVTMAAAEEIDKNKSHGLNLTAVAAGAGGFDLKSMLKEVSVKSYYPYPSYLAFVLMSYNTTYDWNKPLDYFFRNQYAEALTKHMTGNYEGGYINSKLTTNIPNLFNKTFYARLKESDGEMELKKAIMLNTILPWKTSVPMRFYHGTSDEIIPVTNTQDVVAGFKTAGSDNISLKVFKGGTHGSSYYPMLQDFVPWFLEFN